MSGAGVSTSKIDWEKVVLAVIKAVDYDIWKEYVEPHDDCIDSCPMDGQLAFVIETAMIAAGELEGYSK